MDDGLEIHLREIRAPEAQATALGRKREKGTEKDPWDLFVDVGANEGVYCRLLSRNFKTIYAIEPNPVYQNELPSNVIRLNVALSNENGEKIGSSILELEAADTLPPEFDYKPDKDPFMMTKKIYTAEKRIKVKTVTYDTFIRGELQILSR